MSPVTIISNRVPRQIIEGYELSEAERAEFEYIDWKGVEMGSCSPQFFRYKGELYDLSEFDYVAPHNNEFQGWDGFQSDSYFSGILVRYVEDSYDGEVVVGRFYS